ncbi:MAG: hypothetical protein E7616_09345 [Ruminococcaceae bacterium]|nr:hypothetical protein [Oscillospiraceae bacterium]
MKYEQLKLFSHDEIQKAIFDGEVQKLYMIPLSVGEYSNDSEYAQDICLMLLGHKNSKVRANAVLGFSYIARKHQTLDESIIPLLQYEYDNNQTERDRIREAIEDISLFLGWGDKFTFAGSGMK